MRGSLVGRNHLLPKGGGGRGEAAAVAAEDAAAAAEEGEGERMLAVL